MKVLIAEDCNELRFLLADTMKSLNCEVATAEDGKAALDYLLSESFDVLITDFNMPIMNGPELIENLISKEIPLKKIIVFSALISNQDEMGNLLSTHPSIEFLDKVTGLPKLINIISSFDRI